MTKWIFLLLLTACFEDKKNPETALKDFVESRLGSVVTRQFVLERVTGKMKLSLEHVSDEEFSRFADLRNVKKDSFKILSKSCQDLKCFITYTITYQTKQEEKTAYSTEVKKIAELLKVEDKWLIADVSNIKTYVEASDPINPLD